jgi:hypothetical protein
MAVEHHAGQRGGLLLLESTRTGVSLLDVTPVDHSICQSVQSMMGRTAMAGPLSRGVRSGRDFREHDKIATLRSPGMTIFRHLDGMFP